MISDALRDFRRTWPQLLLTDLLARTVAFVALTPMVGLLVKLFLMRAEDGVLTDEEIAVFLLHPTGLVALVTIGAASLGILFAEQGALMVVGLGAVEDRRVSWLDALRYVGRYGWELVRLGGDFVVRMLLITAPFLAGVGGIYFVFLRAHDINFYLAYQPPEFRRAVTLSAVLGTVLAVIVLKKFADWIMALPLVLFDRVKGRLALRESARRTASRSWRIALLVAAWLLGLALLSAVMTRLVGLLGYLLVPAFGGNPVITVFGIVVTLLVGWLGVLGVSVISATVFPLLIVRQYRALGGTGRLRPEPSARGTLGERAPLRIPGKAILWAVGVVSIAIVVGGYLAARRLGAEGDVAVIAHRGASGAAPENTPAAFDRAIDDGTDWVELDVQENADGVIVVAHDSDFMKVARNGLKVWNATSDELRGIDIGSWFDPEYADQRTPTLRQALELASDRAGVVIELKYYGHDRNLESRVVEVVEETGMEADVMVMSLKLAGLRKASAIRPDWTYGLLNTASVGDLTRLNVDFLALNASAATYSMIRRAHERGMKVYVWTVNDPIRMSVMMSRGVDGIITDEPAIARRVIEVRKELSSLGRLIVWIAGETGLLRVRDQPSTEEDA